MGRAKFAVGKDPEVVVGPLVGYRNWTVIPKQKYLRSWYAEGVIWRPMVPMRASCVQLNNVRPPCNDCWLRIHREYPCVHCNCGIYAYKSANEIEIIKNREGDVDFEVFACGRVALWGKIIECDSGYRAEFAYPTFVVVVGDRLPSEWIRGLEEKYGIPFRVVGGCSGPFDKEEREYTDADEWLEKIFSVLNNHDGE